MKIWKSVFILASLLVSYGDGRRQQEVYKLDIDEQGTRFNETVEINGKDSSVVYKVPKHNNVAQSETLFDYKTGLFATRIPELKECYIQRIPKGQSSPENVRKNLQQYQVFKRSQSTVPVKIIAATVIKEERIDLKKISSRLSAFCGDFAAYKGKQVYYRNHFKMQRNGKIGNRDKRNTKEVTHITYSMKISPVLPSGKKITVNTCEKMATYLPELKKGGCDEKPDDWEFRFDVKTSTCMYSVKCSLGNAPNGGGKVIRCWETHIFTGWMCSVVQCK